jgi:PKD repeat protein
MHLFGPEAPTTPSKKGVLANSFVNLLSPYYGGSNILNIGYWSYWGCYATGYLDELRVSNGIVRWLSTFTPPGAQYTVGSTPPTAGFSANWTSGPAPLPVQFNDTSSRDVTSWSWDFGDGSTSTQEYPSHTYLTPGIYTVSLTASGPGGSNTDTQANYITVTTPSDYGIDQYTKLMLHFDGPNGSKTFTDSEITPKTVTGHGNAQISTAYSKFGGASLNPSGSYLSVPASPDWNFSGDFTIDFWWYHTGGSNNPIISIGASGTYSLSISESGGVVYVWMSSNGTSWDIASQIRMGTSSGTGFDHYALVRAGGTYYTFQKGCSCQLLCKPALAILWWVQYSEHWLLELLGLLCDGLS